ncbi:hypothetical protein DL93DRAFT_2091860 [Clavulina sp. PMI_390]|nr:hypothetical protein DL93DRAFT_2091860 [Clavulina sp. PMI_390]
MDEAGRENDDGLSPPKVIEEKSMGNKKRGNVPGSVRGERTRWARITRGQGAISSG